MKDKNSYPNALRIQRETLEFLALPLLETREERLRRHAARQRMRYFAAGAVCTFVAVLTLAILA